MEAGAEFDIQVACPSLVRSMEGALLSYCSDITLNDSPFTIGMDRLLDIDKPHDYVGKAALQAIAKPALSVAWSVQLWRRPVVPNQHCGRQIRHDVIGHVTRYCWSPAGAQHRTDQRAPPGHRHRAVAGRGDGWREATVVDTPWIPSEKVIPI